MFGDDHCVWLSGSKPFRREEAGFVHALYFVVAATSVDQDYGSFVVFDQLVSEFRVEELVGSGNEFGSFSPVLVLDCHLVKPFVVG